MSREEDIVVLGGGIAGLCMAWELCRRGHPPLLLRGAAPSASTAAAGMLTPMPEAARNPRLGLLAAESLRAYPEFLESLREAGAGEVGYIRSGVVRLAYGDLQAAALREEVGTYEAAGMPSRWLDRRSCLAEVAGVGEAGLSGGLLTYDEAQVQPAWLLAALERAILGAGGRIGESEVVSLDGGVEGAAIGLGGGTTLLAHRVVLALGSWVARLTGLEGLVHPVKGQLLVFSGVPRPERILFLEHDYLVPKADGTLVLGGTMEEVGFSTSGDAAAERLRDLLPRLWPAAVGAPAEVRAGLRPAASDGLPVIGPIPGMAAVHAFTGHFRNGFLLGPLSARLAAAEILGGGLEPGLGPFRPRRLARA